MAMGNAKLLNLAMLIGGFGIGQGSIFIVQTTLVAQNQLELLGNFGLHFSYLVLLVLLVDFGSLTILARETARVSSTEPSREAVSHAFWHIAIWRILMAIGLTGIVIPYAIWSDSDFGKNFALAALPSLWIWAFNANGVLDGYRMGGHSGVYSSIPYLLAAVSLYFSRDLEIAEIGTITGLSISCGYVLAVAGQHLTLRVQNKSIGKTSLKWPLAREFFKSALSVTLAQLPTQFLFRFQLALCEQFLDAAATALLLYARQVITIIAQMLVFVRRIRFPDLVQHLSGAQHLPSMTKLLLLQRNSLVFAAIAGPAVAIIGITASVFGSDAIADAGYTVALYSPLILSEALSLTLLNGLSALGRFRTTATLSLAAAALSATASAALIGQLNLATFALADFLGHLLVITSLAIVVKTQRAA